MTVVQLVPPRANESVVQILEDLLAKAKAGVLSSAAVVFVEGENIGACYTGDAATLYYGAGCLMRELEDGED